MKHFFASLLASVFLLIGSTGADAASCAGYETIGRAGTCSGAGARTILHFGGPGVPLFTPTSTFSGACGTNNFVVLPAPENYYCCLYGQGQAWGAVGASAQTVGDGQTPEVNQGNVRASADLATGKLRYFG